MLPMALAGTIMLCKAFVYFRSKHGGQYHEEDEMNLKLIKFRKTMRNGGEWRQQPVAHLTQDSWKSMSMMKKNDEMRRTQRSLTSQLSVPKRMTEKYEEKLKILRKDLFFGSQKKVVEIDVNNEEVEA
jgi:hypothetical protein